MMDSLPFLFLFVAAYLAGSVNFSILAFTVTGRDDPRGYGSGNPGATNVYRQAGIGWAVAVLLLDVGRAIAVAMVAKAMLTAWQVPWIGLGLILGNRFPCFHGFRGGKGVANYLGFSAAVVPAWAAAGGLAWGIAHLIGRTPFLSSFALIAVLAGGTAVGMQWRGVLGTLLTVLFIVGCHHRNIRERWGRQG